MLLVIPSVLSVKSCLHVHAPVQIVFFTSIHVSMRFACMRVTLAVVSAPARDTICAMLQPSRL